MNWRKSLSVMLLLVVICLLGAVIGLFIGFALLGVQKPGFILHSDEYLLDWLNDGQFWPWPMFGAVIAGLSYATTWLALRRG